MIQRKTFTVGLLAPLLLFACSKGDFDYSQYHTLKGQEVKYTDTLEYTFVPSESKEYNLYLSVRYTDEYEFSNIWWKINDNSGTQRIEIPLFDKAGIPLGNCTGGVCTQTVLWKKINAATEDTLNYKIVQNMRKNPLKNVSEMGLIFKSATGNQ